jgi:nitrile hydratase subunit beta
MGGLHGFGQVPVEPDEPVFHTRWESRVFGLVRSLRGGNIDAGRHGLERLDPVTYLRNGYYGRWFAVLEQTLVSLGVVAPEEVEARMRRRRRTARARKAKPRKTTAKDSTEESPVWRPPATKSYAREVERAPIFAAGEAVRTRNHQPPGHTRLPAYARCHSGTIERVHPAMVYPDDNAHERGENPQYLYTVRFAARELWGDAAEPAAFLYLDLFEPYLERA